MRRTGWAAQVWWIAGRARAAWSCGATPRTTRSRSCRALTTSSPSPRSATPASPLLSGTLPYPILVLMSASPTACASSSLKAPDVCCRVFRSHSCRRYCHGTFSLLMVYALKCAQVSYQYSVHFMAAPTQRATLAAVQGTWRGGGGDRRRRLQRLVAAGSVPGRPLVSRDIAEDPICPGWFLHGFGATAPCPRRSSPRMWPV